MATLRTGEEIMARSPNTLNKFRIVMRTIILLLMWNPCQAEMHKFGIVHKLRTFVEHVEECKNLGYDGLAIVKTPEALAYARQITQPFRLANGNGFFVALRFRVDKKEATWDDGSILALDTPLRGIAPSSWYKFGRIHFEGNITFGLKFWRKKALCGHHNNQPLVAHGNNALNYEPDAVETTLTVAVTSSYQECALMCSQDYLCRAATFDLYLLTCTILGPESYTGLRYSPSAATFLRQFQ